MNSRKKVYLSRQCDKLLLKLPPGEVGLFRFLLEGRDNLAVFTVLDRDQALLKLMFAPENREEVMESLWEIKKDIQIEWRTWPI